MLYGRAGPQGGQGSGRVSPQHAQWQSTPEGRARSRRREVRLGSAAASACGTRRLFTALIPQLQGGLIFGLTAALWGEITVKNGRVQQSNFNDYRMLRIDEVPKIEVHVIKSGEDPDGIGETGANAGPPALRNAIYAATGVALRRLPID